MLNKKAILLQVILMHLDGCKDPSCHVCKLNRDSIVELCGLIDVDPNDVLPSWLKQNAKEPKQYAYATLVET